MRSLENSLMSTNYLSYQAKFFPGCFVLQTGSCYSNMSSKLFAGFLGAALPQQLEEQVSLPIIIVSIYFYCSYSFLYVPSSEGHITLYPVPPTFCSDQTEHFSMCFAPLGIRVCNKNSLCHSVRDLQTTSSVVFVWSLVCKCFSWMARECKSSFKVSEAATCSSVSFGITSMFRYCDRNAICD